MDDCDFMEHVDIQLLELSDNPMDCSSNDKSTQPLIDLDGNDDLTVSSTRMCHQYDERAGTESLLSSTRSQNFDLSRLASKNDESGSCSSSFGSLFNKFSSGSDYGGKTNVEKADVHLGIGKYDDKRVGNRTRSKVARSLAKALFTRDDVAEKESHNSESDRVADMIQLPTCGNEMALELGELPEANALEFVDKFLKINVWEPELENIPKKDVDQTLGSEAITKGLKTLAQKASCRNAYVGGSTFDWDDMKEDESGGEFFIKNKEVLFGTSFGVANCGTKSQKFMFDESRVSQYLGKFRNVKEQKKIHGKMNFVHSDSKLVKCGQIRQHEIMKVDNHKNEQVDVSSRFRDVLDAVHIAEFSDVQNVGIDTHMATGSPLLTNDSSFTVKKQKNGRKRGVNAKVKKSSVRNRPHLSKSDTCNISKQTKQMSMKSRREGSVASRTRSQYLIEEFKVDVLKPKANCRRPITRSISSENERESSGKEHLQGIIDPSNKVKGGRNNRKCRNRSGLASEISAGVAKSTQNINVDMSIDRVTEIPHSPKQVGRNRKMYSSGYVRHEVVLQSVARRTRSMSVANPVPPLKI